MLEKIGMFRDPDGSIKTIFKDRKGDYLDIFFEEGEADILIFPLAKNIFDDEYDISDLVEAINSSIYSDKKGVLHVYYRNYSNPCLYSELESIINKQGNLGYKKVVFHKEMSNIINEIENPDLDGLLHYEFDENKLKEWMRKYKVIEKQRQDYISWDEYFMAISKLSAMRSKDPNTQVGACIVSKDNRLLSIGYNGAPNGYKDFKFPWDREGGNLETKYFFVVHAERNAILNYRGSRKDFEGARLYVDLFPCNECAKEIIQAGISEVVYLSDKYADTESTIASKMLFDECGVKYRQLGEEYRKVLTIDLRK